MILWNVKIPLRAKLGIGAALGLSVFMMIIATIRISLGEVAPKTSDTIWIYFCWYLESSIAVFMVSATAFRSTFGHHQVAKAKRSQNSSTKPLVLLSSRPGEKSFVNAGISTTSPGSSYSGEEEEVYSKPRYQLKINEMPSRMADV